MSNITLQLKRLAPDTIPEGSPIAFDHVVHTDGKDSTLKDKTAGAVGPRNADCTAGAMSPNGTTGPSPLNQEFSASSVTTPSNTQSTDRSETSPSVKDVAPVFDANPASQGFSALISSITAAASTQLTGWTITSPYFNSGAFNETTGEYTVPNSGVYIIEAAINYSTTTPITASLGAAVNPTFAVRRTSPIVTDLISGFLPVLDVDVALILTLRSILANGMVSLTGEIDLTAGDVIGLFYEADGLTVTLDLGGSGAEGIVWSINRLT